MLSTFEQLRDILVRDYSVDAGAITLETPFDSLGIDSLGLAEMLFTLEDEFKVTVSQEPVQLVTVADVVAYIDGLLAARAGIAAPAAKSGLSSPGG